MILAPMTAERLAEIEAWKIYAHYAEHGTFR